MCLVFVQTFKMASLYFFLIFENNGFWNWIKIIFFSVSSHQMWISFISFSSGVLWLSHLFQHIYKSVTVCLPLTSKYTYSLLLFSCFVCWNWTCWYPTCIFVCHATSLLLSYIVFCTYTKKCICDEENINCTIKSFILLLCSVWTVKKICLNNQMVSKLNVATFVCR